MRIYIPAVGSELGADGLSPRVVHAVTASLARAADVSGVPAGEVQAVLEAMAMNAAADDSLRMLVRLSGAETPRRIVAVAEMPEASLRPCADPEQLPTALELVDPVGWCKVQAIHADDCEAEAVIAAAVDGGDDEFEKTYGEELMWFDVTERLHLAAELSGRAWRTAGVAGGQS